MKIGVISDTHIPDKAKEIPEAALKEFSSADMVIHAGDLVDMSVLDKLKSVCRNVHAVWGNMDPYDLRQALPEKEVINVNKFKLGLMHGFGAPASLIGQLAEAFKNDKVDIIVFGHSHAPVNETRDGVIYFNPGSATDKVFAPFNSYGIIEIEESIKTRIVKI